MLRSAASPGSVGFGRFGGGTSGLLMTPLPTGHLFQGAPTALIHSLAERNKQGARFGRPFFWPAAARYLILDSRNSTCFLATGSYFFFTSLSVMVREFFRVT